MAMEMHNGTGQYLNLSALHHYLVGARQATPSEHYASRAYRTTGPDLASALERTDPWVAPLEPYGLPHMGLGYSPFASSVASADRLPNQVDRHASGPGSYSPGDPLARFLEGKREFLARSAMDILASLYERKSLHETQMQRLDEETVGVESGLLPIDHHPPGRNPIVDRRRDSLERQLQSLERERRMHEVATWRDTTRLRGDLRTVLGELEGETRRWSLLYPQDPPYR